MTQDYIGTKQVVAWEQEKDGCQGYAVKYADGYVSWSPKDVFEASYLPMGHVGHLQPHQQRVVAEKVELDHKIAKLTAFLETPAWANLSVREQKLLNFQYDAMAMYSAVLALRIKEF